MKELGEHGVAVSSVSLKTGHGLSPLKILNMYISHNKLKTHFFLY